jgi:hypothetical protein
MPPSQLAVLLRFHLGIGARLAGRVALPALVCAVAAAMFLGPDFVKDLSFALFGPRAGVSGALLALGAALAVAAVAARRVSTGLCGWLRHLPVAAATHRRAAIAAILVAELPLLLLLAAAAGLALPARAAAGAAAAAPLAGLPVVGLAAAFATLRVRRRVAVVLLALVAGLLAGSGSWWTLAVALSLLAAADRVAGRLSPVRAAAASPRRRAPAREAVRTPPPRAPAARCETDRRRAPAAGTLAATARIAWRALGWRLAQAYCLASLAWLAAALFIANNRLEPPYPARAGLLGGAVAVALLLAALARTLAVRRPAWPWARSLPWSARRRVGEDAALLGALCLPWVALTAWLAPAAALPLAGFIPLLAVRAAGAARRGPESRRGPAGEVLSEGLLLAGLLALLPWAAPALLAAVPWAVAAAAARERRQDIGRWQPRHHLAVGDPQAGGSG